MEKAESKSYKHEPAVTLIVSILRSRNFKFELESPRVIFKPQ